MPSKEVPSHPSTIENIDTAVFRLVNEVLDPYVNTNSGREKVKVIWYASERAFQIKNNKDLRDGVGKLKLPIITIARTSVSKDDNFKGAVQSEFLGHGHEDRIQVKRVIRQDKTQNFTNADFKRETDGTQHGISTSKKVVYETITIPRPVYITCMFEVFIRTEYQQQMNDILPLFITERKRNFLIENDGYRYEAFLEPSYGINNSGDLGEEERMFTSKVSLKVLGYITGNDHNDEDAFIQREESIVEVKISRERVIVGDSKPWDKSGENFRDL